MKNIIYMCIAAISFVACNNNEKLDRETALKLIKDSKSYPKVLSYNIFISDPLFAKRVLDAGLEESGLVVVQPTRKLGDAGKPIISFTPKAEHYLLPQSDLDKSEGLQRVKLADEVVQQVTGIQLINDGEKAVVETETSFKNVTPFSTLSKVDYSQKRVQKIKFALYDNGWRLDNQ